MSASVEQKLNQSILPVQTAEQSVIANSQTMPRELARFLLTQTAEPIQTLTKSQEKAVKELESKWYSARESNQFSSYSNFLEKAVDISFFAASFFLNTPVATMIKDAARETLFSKPINNN